MAGWCRQWAPNTIHAQVRCTTTLLRYDFVLLLYLSISKARLSRLPILLYMVCVFFYLFCCPLFTICQPSGFVKPLWVYIYISPIHNEYDHKNIHNGFADRGIYAMPFAPCHRLKSTINRGLSSLFFVRWAARFLVGLTPRLSLYLVLVTLRRICSNMICLFY